MRSKLILKVDSRGAFAPSPPFGGQAAGVIALVAIMMLGARAQAAAEGLFGLLPDGRPVVEYTIRNHRGTVAHVLSLGATLRELTLPDRAGHRIDVVLGYDTLQDYLAGKAYFGATVGRYANRIANAELPLNGKSYRLTANNGVNTLHGGASGFNRALWVIDGSHRHEDSVRLKYVSAAGEEGFPGQVTVWVTYTLTTTNELKITYQAKTSATTVVNFTNHSYFNLGGAGLSSVLDEPISVEADSYTPANDQGIPTGAIEPVAGTDYDLRLPESLAAHLQAARGDRLVKSKSVDINFVLRGSGNGLRHAASVADLKTGLALDVFTTEPGLQLFTPNFPPNRLIGKEGRDYGGYAAICLETQHFPDSPHFSRFPTTVLEAGSTFHSETVYRFSLNAAAP